MEQLLDLIHSRWPDRVVLISEFASLDLENWADEARADYVRQYIELLRRRPYIAGASVWTFNDYRSRWPAVTADGYRHFGAITADRHTTALYRALRQQFAPALIESARPTSGERALSVDVTVAARADFPAYTLRDYKVRCSWLEGTKVTASSEAPLPLLRPGSKATVTCAADHQLHRWEAAVRIEVVRPTGFVVTEFTSPAR